MPIADQKMAGNANVRTVLESIGVKIPFATESKESWTNFPTFQLLDCSTYILIP